MFNVYSSATDTTPDVVCLAHYAALGLGDIAYSTINAPADSICGECSYDGLPLTPDDLTPEQQAEYAAEYDQYERDFETPRSEITELAPDDLSPPPPFRLDVIDEGDRHAVPNVSTLSHQRDRDLGHLSPL